MVKRVGIVGGGQLAQMMAKAGQSLGLSFSFLDPNPDACAFAYGHGIIGNYDDTDKLAELASHSDVITFEFENVPAESILYLHSLVPVYPSPDALKVTQDRFSEKTLFQSLGIPTVRFLTVTTVDDLRHAAQELGVPFIIKTRRQGYDGKGQAVVRDYEMLDDVFDRFSGHDLIAEAMAPFSREISVIGVRSHTGEKRFFDISVNVHENGILKTAHAQHHDHCETLARTYVSTLMDYFNYVGVFTLELFDCPQGILANEYAPRVHNSGHWTIEGAETSQFETHLRAICHLPLGGMDSIGFPAIINCIGTLPDASQFLESPHLTLHSYNKQPRPGRKLGHLFVTATTPAERDSVLHSR
jgi:5-(carboxyamino)imidazole ribonucleotide synthase